MSQYHLENFGVTELVGDKILVRAGFVLLYSTQDNVLLMVKAKRNRKWEIPGGLMDSPTSINQVDERYIINLDQNNTLVGVTREYREEMGNMSLESIGNMAILFNNPIRYIVIPDIQNSVKIIYLLEVPLTALESIVSSFSVNNEMIEAKLQPITNVKDLRLRREFEHMWTEYTVELLYPPLARFCNGDLEAFDDISELVRDTLINLSFVCLNKKIGNQERARWILLHSKLLSEIKLSNGSSTLVSNQKIDEPSRLESLVRYGVMTIKVYDQTQVKSIREELKETIATFPEYLRDPKDPSKNSAGRKMAYVLGGFGALGNPASFHNTCVRKIRIKSREKVYNNFMKLYSQQNLEMLFDRLLFRQKSQKPGSDLWHRDVIANNLVLENDELFGGWINLSENDQEFSCIPSSHLGIRLNTLQEGFATIPQDDISKVSGFKQTIKIKPGHMILFPQYILHEVLNKQAPSDQYRLFMGWRITNSTNFLHPDTELGMQTQAVMRLPSSQIPAMYSSMHYGREFKPVPDFNYSTNIETWSRNSFQPQCVNHKIVRRDKSSYYTIPRYMKSLMEYNLLMYPKYTQEEIDMYRPNPLS